MSKKPVDPVGVSFAAASAVVTAAVLVVGVAEDGMAVVGGAVGAAGFILFCWFAARFWGRGY